MSAVEKFPVLLSEAEEESSAVPPCFSDEGINVRILEMSQYNPTAPRCMELLNMASFACAVPLHPP